ncbi:hypothetical protein ACVW1A_000261 [Bradyrhizobium sp. LB1.3]
MNAVAGRGKHVKDAENSGGMRVITEYKGCRSSSNNGKGRCGSQAASGDLPSEICDKAKSHPCYSEEAHHHYARMHVEVAPDCNIQCNYCNRKYDCADESHPAVVGEKLTPEQAARKLVAVATTIPQLSILGIAGPGEALADPKTTFKTFELVARAAPDIKLCLPTNGLDLPRRDMPLQNRPPHPSTRSIPKSVPGYINVLGVSQPQALHRNRGCETNLDSLITRSRDVHGGGHPVHDQFSDGSRH